MLLVLLAVLAAVVSWLAGLGALRNPLIAAGRAVVQLAAVSTVIGAVLHSLGWTLLFLAGMVLVAGGTSARRISASLRPAAWWTLAPIAAGVVPTVLLILLSTVVPHNRLPSCRPPAF